MLLPIVLLGLVALTRANPPIDSFSHGAIWPQPQKMSCEVTQSILAPESLFKLTYVTANNASCEIIDKAIQRYLALIYTPNIQTFKKEGKNAAAVTLSALDLNLTGPCESRPYFGMDESYLLSVTNATRAQLASKSVWGLLRGLESFTHLLWISDDLSTRYVNPCTVSDFPRFAHRGLLIDSSRHFLLVDKIIETLDLMSYNKFNVLHWHIVDDQSFPYYSQVFPAMSGKAAWTPRDVYSVQDVQNIVEQGRQRGIRIVPEFDSPGHTRAWGPGLPNFLCECFNSLGQPTGDIALPNPVLQSTWDYILALFTEILQVFPDQFIHLGGDEVSADFNCWVYNPMVAKWMDEMGYVDGNQVEAFYLTQLYKLVARARANTGMIMWQEVFDQNVTSNPNVIAEVWKGSNQSQINAEMADITSRGYRAILSSCWYLNYISYGDDWNPYYECEPQAFDGTDAQHRLVVGGEVCMWGEYVDGTNLTPRLWPRSSAVAEKLWSAMNFTAQGVTDSVYERMEEHRCRMMNRNHPVEPPHGPNYCLLEYGQTVGV